MLALLAMYILPHNPAWKDIFDSVSRAIREKVSIEIELHHIGSTAINNLSAKNCIDILGVIEDFEVGLTIIKPIEDLGFIYKGEYGIQQRHYFSKPGDPKIHFHICPRGHEQIQRHLHFVKVMRSSPNLIKELNEFKDGLARKFSKEIYQVKKEPFYDKIRAIKL